MKLACIVNLWDGEEILEGALKRIAPHADLFIIVYQVVSNFGEPHSPMTNVNLSSVAGDFIYHKFTPDEIGGTVNERRKRNIGLSIAKTHGCTHFLHLDCDEYYEDFGKLKQEYLHSGAAGSVCPIYTYFKLPTWRLEKLDGYYVPFIHELREDTNAGMSSYPFYVDPTRGINQGPIVQLSMPMHHFSWVRHDIERKARNSSAGQHGNKLKGLLDDYANLDTDLNPTGYVIKDMGMQKLIVVDDIFGLQKIFLPLKGDKIKN